MSVGFQLVTVSGNIETADWVDLGPIADNELRNRLKGTMEYWGNHSGLMFAALINLAHFSDCSTTSRSRSAGDALKVVAPKSRRRAVNSGSARRLRIDHVVEFIDDLTRRVFRSA